MDVCTSVMASLDITEQQLFLKQRKRQRGHQQYEKYGRDNATKTVEECGLTFEVNLSDYVDLGLFLDHRPLRQRIRDEAKGKRVLNCFAYTGSFSCYAAAGGAKSVCTIDLSNTYLEWFKRNLALNHLSEAIHDIQRGDCVDILRSIGSSPFKYDIIICDPPTFSNSKNTDEDFIIQHEHPALIKACMRCLHPDGVVYFSTNFRKFKMDPHIEKEFHITNITSATIPEDFRNDRIHYCWEIRMPS